MFYTLPYAALSCFFSGLYGDSGSCLAAMAAPQKTAKLKEYLPFYIHSDSSAECSAIIATGCKKYHVQKSSPEKHWQKTEMGRDPHALRTRGMFSGLFIGGFRVLFLSCKANCATASVYNYGVLCSAQHQIVRFGSLRGEMRTSMSRFARTDYLLSCDTGISTLEPLLHDPFPQFRKQQ